MSPQWLRKYAENVAVRVMIDTNVLLSAMLALKDAQDAFLGEAERLGLKTEQDVAAMVKEVRRERGRARNG